MQQSDGASQELHKRRTQPDDSEIDPVVAQLGEDCSKLYAKLEVRNILDSLLNGSIDECDFTLALFSTDSEFAADYATNIVPKFLVNQTDTVYYYRSAWVKTIVTGERAKKVSFSVKNTQSSSSNFHFNTHRPTNRLLTFAEVQALRACNEKKHTIN
jgi:hypothetical protein